MTEAGEDAKLLAGGQSLMPLLGYRLARPTHLVDIDRVSELTGVEGDERGRLRLGALTRHAWVERARWSGSRTLLGEAAALIGHVPIRARGTLAGSIAHADPAAELPVALLALGAEVEVRSAAGLRAVPIDAFFTGPFSTVLGPAELVTGVVLPPCRAASAGAFAEFAVRSGDFALASAAVAADVIDGRLQVGARRARRRRRHARPQRRVRGGARGLQGRTPLPPQPPRLPATATRRATGRRPPRTAACSSSGSWATRSPGW